MLEVDDIAYSREATIGAVRDYYQFLVELYLDDSEIIEPPKGGWPAISREFQHFFGKSDEVIALLRDLPYIRENSPIPTRNDPPQGSSSCYWADWQKLAADSAEAANAGEDMGEFGENLKGMSELWLEDVLDHVVGLTFGDSYNAHTFLLDTKFGVVHRPDSCGGGHHQANVDNDPSFIEPVWGVDEHAPENEEWRSSSPAWSIPDFFKLLKKQYRELKWIPINTREVINSKMIYAPPQEGTIPMLQGIFRQHGWASEEGGIYRKRECLAAVKAALEEHFPTFENYD